mmetsp:Transcript_10132/g.16643  ORF Transcript_10132/g.16643 Transcript_10132/m.16643 type:complete len:526 (-) Transcript_10132:274-1851(-)
MKVISITFQEFNDLRQAKKRFLCLFCAVWNAKINVGAKKLLSRHLSDEIVMFQILVDTNSDMEDFCLNILRVNDLPALFLFDEKPLPSSCNFNLTNKDIHGLSEVLDGPTIRSLTTFKNSCEGIFSLWNNSKSPTNLFVSGDRSSVGKSSVCLALLVSLVKQGIPPSALAYIKPVTQCEAEQPVVRFCSRAGIAHQGIGPVVFYKGFTRAYLAGETEPAHNLIEQAREAVETIGRGKRFVLVDGVGYPSVGSICGISNAHVARALNSPVLLVGKSGVGDAVDSYNLNSAYFENKGVKVLGGIFNKLPLEGYYSLASCKESVLAYFSQYSPHQLPYGFIPLLPTAVDLIEQDDSGGTIASCTTNGNSFGDDSTVMDVVPPVTSTTSEAANTTSNITISLTRYEANLAEAFLEHVDIDRLMHDAWIHTILNANRTESISNESGNPSTDISRPDDDDDDDDVVFTGTGRLLQEYGRNNQQNVVTSMKLYADSTDKLQDRSISSSSSGQRKRSRAEVEREARSQGAAGG